MSKNKRCWGWSHNWTRWEKQEIPLTVINKEGLPITGTQLKNIRKCTNCGLEQWKDFS